MNACASDFWRPIEVETLNKISNSISKSLIANLKDYYMITKRTLDETLNQTLHEILNKTFGKTLNETLIQTLNETL